MYWFISGDEKALENGDDFDHVQHIKYMKRFCTVVLKFTQTPDMDYASFREILNKKCCGKFL